MDVDMLKTGRELDAQVHELVMGWRLTDKRPPSPQNWAAYPDVWYENIRGHLLNVTGIPHYSSDKGEVWQVLEHLRFLGWHITIIMPEQQPDDVFTRFTVHLARGHEERVTVSHEGIGIAICAAALKAVE